MDLFGDSETSAAVLSECRRYRYRLARTWSKNPPMVFVMLNPSTADEVDDDPTIRRCVGFAKREGCGGIIVVNLFAYRSTDPHALTLQEDPVGTENDSHSPRVVVAWGNGNPKPARAARVLELIWGAGSATFCLGVTAAGNPKHPVRLAADTPLVPYPIKGNTHEWD